MTSYIGELEFAVADVLVNPISRGLLRLEGFVQRLQPDAVSDLAVLHALGSGLCHLGSIRSPNQHPPLHPPVKRHVYRPNSHGQPSLPPGSGSPL